MRVSEGVLLAPFTTLGLGGVARVVEADTADEVVAVVTAADLVGDTVLVLGGGSNVVLPDAGVPGVVVRVVTRGVTWVAEGDRVLVTAQAGEPWDDLVAAAVADGLAGLECLSGVPGAVGGTPVQNVGAYGQEVADTVTTVRVLDRRDAIVRDLPAADCGFGYRRSAFKHSGRWVVLAVTYSLVRRPLSQPVRYAELARALSLPVGTCAPLADVRAAVLALRRRKGMVRDPADPDSASVGSFFTNPVLSVAEADALAARVGAGVVVPSWPEPDGRVKVSAAWLVEHAGFGRGYGGPTVALSAKHTLALTHRGGGSTAELLALAREVRDGVLKAFGVTLVAEPVIVGDTL